MLTKNPFFSLVLPCYNEAEHLNESVVKIITVLRNLKVPFEIIFIDDKSKDTTRQLLKKIIKKYPQYKISVIYHTKNLGRGATVAQGILKAKGKIVGYLDIDCEISPLYLKVFLRELKKDIDILIAKRLYKFSIFALPRFIASRLYALIVKKVFDLPVSDTEAGFKLFQKDKILGLISKVKDKHWFWDTEIIVVAHKHGLKVKEIPVSFKRRLDKTSTVNLTADSIKYIQGIYNLKRKLEKSQNK